MDNQSVTRLQAILALLPAELKAPILAQTIRQAELLRGSMIIKVPIGGPDDKHRGRLRDSIRVEKGRGEMRVLVRAGGPTTTIGGGASGGGVVARVRRAVFGGGSYDYALAQEFGTQKMHAHPFFWSSYRARKDDIRRALKATAKAEIKKNWHD